MFLHRIFMRKMYLSRKLKKLISASNAKGVRRLLQENNINLRTPENSHLLWLAVCDGNIEIIESLIRAGADVHADVGDEGEGHEILHMLALKASHNKEYARLVLLAIEHGADVNRINRGGISLLQLTVMNTWSTELSKGLLARGAREDGENLDRMLENVVVLGKNPAEMLPLLIASNNPSAETRSQRTTTALITELITPYYNPHIFEELSQEVMDVDQFGSNGFTMLAAAARKGRLDAVTVLLYRGADVNKKTMRGMLPIYAASMSDDSAVTNLLISRGASIYDRNDDGKYPVHGACSSCTVDNLHFLLSHGASVDVTDYNGEYPIHIACINNMCEEILHLLLSLGTCINVVDDDGNSPLSFVGTGQRLFPATILYIKQFAFIQVTTGAVSEKDLTIIKADPEMFKFYQYFYNELQITSQIVVFENFNLLSLLATSTIKLSAYLKNTEFAVAIENCVQQQRARFPSYYKQFDIALQIARKKRDVIQNMENVLEQSFPVAIPDLVIQKITHYVLFEELDLLELDFYLALYRSIKARGHDFLTTIIMSLDMADEPDVYIYSGEPILYVIRNRL